MFVMKHQVTAFWPVKVKEPNPTSPGTFVEHKFEIEWTLIDRDQAQAQNDLRDGILNSGKDAKEIVAELQDFDDATYADAANDWRGVVDERKCDIPYSREVLLQAMKRPLIKNAIARSYEEMASGEIRKKN